MQRIITITLSPAFDIHYYVERFQLGKENYSSKRIVDAGGKGINISRALLAHGMASLSIVAMGENNAAEFKAMLDAERLEYLEFLCPGSIRHNITIHPEDGPETRLMQEGFYLGLTTLWDIEEAITPHLGPGTLVAFSGRVPRGVPMGVLKPFLCTLKKNGALLALDSSGLAIEDLAEIKPWLIKPNEQEVEALFGRGIRTEDEVLSFAQELHQLGVENVLISLGERGLVYAGSELRCHLRVPKITPVSTIGAGDSTLAGYMFAYVQGWDKIEILKTAAAFGTAACLTPGTQPPQPEVVARVKAEIEVEL